MARFEPLAPHGSTGPINTAQVRLTDFGLSAMCSAGQQLAAPYGTVSYAAPEVLLCRAYDRSVDLWSLGVVTYVILAGAMAFRGRTEKEIAQAVVACNYTFAKPEGVWDKLSNASKAFVSALLVSEPTSRPSAIEALRVDWVAEAAVFKESTAFAPLPRSPPLRAAPFPSINVEL